VQHPQLALIKVHIDLETQQMRVSAPSVMHDSCLTIPLNTNPTTEIALRVCGDRCVGLVYNDEINNWFSECIGVRCSLVRTLLDAPRVCNIQRIASVPSVGPSVTPNPAAAAVPTASKLLQTISFANESQYLLVSQASIDELQSRIASTSTELLAQFVPAFMNKPPKLLGAITAERFRPNLVVAGNDLVPHIEDTWHRIAIGTHQLNVCGGARACVRASYGIDTCVANRALVRVRDAK
jgi:molybdenum cofactor sulfurtransferase